MNAAVTRFIASLHQGVGAAPRWLLVANVATVASPIHSATRVRRTTRRLTSRVSSSRRSSGSNAICLTVRKLGEEWETSVPLLVRPEQVAPSRW